METNLLQLSYSIETIDAAATRFWEALAGYRLLAFSAEMGAGKTTFIHRLCDHIGVEDAVSSPTFALINEYHFWEKDKEEIIFHMDWYRLRDTGEAINAGMEDCLLQAAAGSAYCFIEWPEKAKDLLPVPYVWISIETAGIGERKMEVVLVGE